MANFKDIRSKVSSALFSKLGEQGQLVKRDGTSIEVALIVREQTFEIDGKILTSSKSIKLKSEVKPELYDKIVVSDVEHLIKSSPQKLTKEIYEIKIK